MSTVTAAGALMEEYRAAQAKIAGQASKAVAAAFQGLLDPYNLDRSFPAYAAAAQTAISNLSAESAALGGKFYLAHREAMGVFDQVPSIAWHPGGNPAQITTSLLVTGPVTIKKAISQGADLRQAFHAAESASAGSAYRYAANGGRFTIHDTVYHDPKALGWMRVTDGRPCAFCAMLASRGAVYKTAQSAGAVRKYHDRCGCYAVPYYEGSPTWVGAGEDFQRLYYEAQKDPSLSGSAAARFRQAYDKAYPKGSNPAAALEARLVAEAKAEERRLFESLDLAGKKKAAALEKKWKGKPAPKKPVEPQKPEGRLPTADEWAPWRAKVEQRFSDFTGGKKRLDQSLNWHQIRELTDGTIAPEEVVKRLAWMEQNHYIDAALKAEARALIEQTGRVTAEQEAAYKAALRSYRNRATRYERYLKEWREANGITSVLDGMDGARSLVDARSARAWLTTLPQPVGKARDALQTYTGGSYRDWNTALRNAKGELPASSHWHEQTVAADQGFTPAPEAFLVRRGSGFDEFEIDGRRVTSMPPPDPKDLVGTVHTQHGYWSTSYGDSGAFGGSVALEIRVPQGYPVSFAEPYSWHSGEREVILKRGANFFVHDVHPKPGGYGWIMEVEILPEGLDPASVVGHAPMPKTKP